VSVLQIRPTERKENIISLLQGIFEGHEFSYQTDNNGKVWFVAKDVCEILGIKNASQAIERLDEDEKLIYTLHISGQNREVLTINESGLYSLISTSRKATAKRFKKYVNGIVLPEIRKTGSFNAQPKPALTLVESVKLMLVELEGKDIIIQEKNLLIEKKDNEIAAIKPVVDFVDSSFIPNKNSLPLKVFAKIHGFVYPNSKNVALKGSDSIYELLKGQVSGFEKIKYLMWNGEPLAEYDSNNGKGYFELKYYEEGFAPSPRITPKGQIAVFKKLARYGIHPAKENNK